MENQKESNQACNCSDGCCNPKKKISFWKLLIFCIIILSAGTIIAAKVVGKNVATTEKCCAAPENPSCCQQTVTITEAACCAQPASAACSQTATLPASSCCAQPSPACCSEPQSK